MSTADRQLTWNRSTPSRHGPRARDGSPGGAFGATGQRCISGGFLVFLLLAVLPGAPLLGKLVGHGPNDPFPYAVDISLKPVGPWAHVPDTSSVPNIDPVTFKQSPPPKGTGTTLMVLGADGSLGRDELQRLLYGGRVSLMVAIGATLLTASSRGSPTS